MVGLNHEIRARAAVARVSRPTSAAATSASSGTSAAAALPPRPTEDALRETAARHPAAAHLAAASPRSATTTTARPTATTRSELVLVIRGELLKRYPTAVIYAQQARAGSDDADGTIDTQQGARCSSTIDAGRGGQAAARQGAHAALRGEGRSRHLLLRLRPHVDGGKGGDGTSRDDDPGWFFVIKERPGEPRFGLDDVPASTTPRLITWNDLSLGRSSARRAASCIAARPADSTLTAYDRRSTRGQARARRRQAGRSGIRASTRPSSPTSSIRCRCWSPCTPARCCRHERTSRRAARATDARAAPASRRPPATSRSAARSSRRCASRSRRPKRARPAPARGARRALQREADAARRARSTASRSSSARLRGGRRRASSTSSRPSPIRPSRSHRSTTRIPILLFPVRIETRFTHRPVADGRADAAALGPHLSRRLPGRHASRRCSPTARSRTRPRTGPRSGARAATRRRSAAPGARLSAAAARAAPPT